MAARNGAIEALTPDVLLPLIRDGLSMNKIAKRLGYSQASVTRAIKLHKLKPARSYNMKTENYPAEQLGNRELINRIFR